MWVSYFPLETSTTTYSWLYLTFYIGSQYIKMKIYCMYWYFSSAYTYITWTVNPSESIIHFRVALLSELGCLFFDVYWFLFSDLNSRVAHWCVSRLNLGRWFFSFFGIFKFVLALGHSSFLFVSLAWKTKPGKPFKSSLICGSTAVIMVL